MIECKLLFRFPIEDFEEEKIEGSIHTFLQSLYSVKTSQELDTLINNYTENLIKKEIEPPPIYYINGYDEKEAILKNFIAYANRFNGLDILELEKKINEYTIKTPLELDGLRNYIENERDLFAFKFCKQASNSTAETNVSHLKASIKNHLSSFGAYAFCKKDEQNLLDYKNKVHELMGKKIVELFHESVLEEKRNCPISPTPSEQNNEQIMQKEFWVGREAEGYKELTFYLKLTNNCETNSKVTRKFVGYNPQFVLLAAIACAGLALTLILIFSNVTLPVINQVSSVVAPLLNKTSLIGNNLFFKIPGTKELISTVSPAFSQAMNVLGKINFLYLAPLFTIIAIGLLIYKKPPLKIIKEQEIDALPSP